ncbi:MAG TPA: hypothetical protein VKB46_12715 [Pyrinomonadaceae bacterium]|nr:hypothetical protein [Pyrinomonadaceae bacterium]
MKTRPVVQSRRKCADEALPRTRSALASAAPSAPIRSPSPRLAGETLLGKYNRDQATDNVVRYLTEALPPSAAPSMRRLVVANSYRASWLAF